MKTKTDRSAVLFPHVSLTEQTLKWVLTLFRPLDVHIPWLLQEPAFMKSYQEEEALRIVHPPEEAKPGGDFFKILKAYKAWSLEQQDMGYAAFLKAQPGMDPSESSTWGIRGELRRFGRETPPTEAPLFLKWHLILHLAREMEDQNREADSLLKSLKDKKSPLRGVLETDDVENVFADLPHFQADAMFGESHWAQIIDAWLGLFGGYLTENDVLVTFDRHVFEVLSEQINPMSFEGTVHPEPPLLLEIPDLSAQTLEEINDIVAKAAPAKNLFEIMEKMGEQGASKQETPAGEIQAFLSRHASQGSVRVTARRIKPPTGGAKDRGDGKLTGLTGRHLVLFEEVS